MSVSAFEPSVMLVPLKLALFVIDRLEPVAWVIPAVEVTIRLPALLLPVNSVLLSSAMFTAPVTLKFRAPKLIESPIWLPSVIELATSEAVFVTLNEAFDVFVMAPCAPRIRLLVAFVPVKSIELDSKIVTPPAELNVRLP